MTLARPLATLALVCASLSACKTESATDAGELDAGISFEDAATDAAAADIGPNDLGSADADPTDVGAADAGDAGPGDLGPFDAADAGHDAGLLDPCPSGSSPPCARAADCEADIPPPSNCGACVPFNESLCAATICESPAVLGAGDLYNIVITLEPNIPELGSLSAFAVSSRTAGGITIGCADLYAGRIDFANRCYNVLLTRAYVVSQPGQSFSVGFVGFTSGERTLFVINGHTDSQARTPAVGVSCTEHDVPAPSNGGPYFVSGDAMRRL